LPSNNKYDRLMNDKLFHATKEELTLMLYEGALKFCNQAIAAVEAKDHTAANDLIIKVENIIREFQLTLDRKYDISTQLNTMYTYIYARLLDANIKKDKEILEEVRYLLRELRDTWKEAMKLAKQQEAGAPALSKKTEGIDV